MHGESEYPMWDPVQCGVEPWGEPGCAYSNLRSLAGDQNLNLDMCCDKHLNPNLTLQSVPTVQTTLTCKLNICMAQK